MSTQAEPETVLDEALTRVEANADEDWLTFCADTIRAVPFGQMFTTDHVWFALADPATDSPTTHEPRALGAVLRRLARDGEIRQTGQYVRSRRRECHSRPIPVWVRRTP